MVPVFIGPVVEESAMHEPIVLHVSTYALTSYYIYLSRL